MDETVLIATVGQGIMWSANKDPKWRRIDLRQDIEYDGIVQCVVVHPSREGVAYAGGQDGLAVSEDGGVSWTHVPTPADGMQVWRIAIDEQNPDIMFVGTGAPSRVAIFRTLNGGKDWKDVTPEVNEFCLGVHLPRVTTIRFDPSDTKQVWFGLEEGGVFRTHDTGDSWTRIDGPDTAIQSSDIHAVEILPGPPKTILVVTVNALYVSQDDGQSWTETNVKQAFGIYYSRLTITQPDSNTVFLGIGDGTPGTVSKILRSKDFCQSWDETPLSEPAKSTVWAFGTHPSDPKRIFFGTKFGELYRSENGGDSWEKDPRLFSEISDIVWLPFKATPPPTEYYHVPKELVGKVEFHEE